MSVEKEATRRRRRQLTAEERTLWHTVTRSIAPLRGTGQLPESADPEPAPVDPTPAQPAAPASAAAPAPKKPSVPPLAPLAPLERRIKQRLGRGSEPIDGRLDLHGLTQHEAHMALASFLRGAQAREAKLVLVITGKGARGTDDPFGDRPRGVLKRLVPQWLKLPEFRSYVVGFEPAHAGHGGEGALYVRVRRAR
jgi:DNA-nicking Smr family endonuclease